MFSYTIFLISFGHTVVLMCTRKERGGKKKRRKLDLRRDCQWWNTHSELPSSESEKHVSIFRTVEWRSQLQKVTAIRDLKDLFVSMAKRSSTTTIFKTCVNELVTWELTFLRCANHTKNQLNFLRIKTLKTITYVNKFLDFVVSKRFYPSEICEKVILNALADVV